MTGRPIEQSNLRRESCPAAKCIVWYAPGNAVEVVIDGHVIRVQLVGRKGRKARIAITAPAGTEFIEIS